MPLSMLNEVDAPPLNVQASVELAPLMMVAGAAVNVSMTGGGGFTVTVTVLVTVPEAFEAVKM